MDGLPNCEPIYTDYLISHLKVKVTIVIDRVIVIENAQKNKNYLPPENQYQETHIYKLYIYISFLSFKLKTDNDKKKQFPPT